MKKPTSSKKDSAARKAVAGTTAARKATAAGKAASAGKKAASAGKKAPSAGKAAAKKGAAVKAAPVKAAPEKAAAGNGAAGKAASGKTPAGKAAPGKTPASGKAATGKAAAGKAPASSKSASGRPSSYKQAGVDVRAGEAFVRRLKAQARRPLHDTLWPAAGGYAAVLPFTPTEGVAMTTDGVGTKLLLATRPEHFRGLGRDLVAMCANDLICVGATPTAFLDYYAMGKLEARAADALIEGIVAACDEAGMGLVGGETAELPDLYAEGRFDLAGFAMGRVNRERLLTGEDIQPGDYVWGVASTGIHSNGLSLARKLLGAEWHDELLRPTAIYVQAIQQLGPGVKALAHITGGGWRNLLRLNPRVGFRIDLPMPMQPVFQELARHLSFEEMLGTFNMGMGLAVITRELLDLSPLERAGFKTQLVGAVTDEAGRLMVETQDEQVVLKA